MVNRALLTEFEIPDKNLIIGRYNIFKDPEIAKAGLTDLVREVFAGSIRTATDIKVPIKSIREFYQIRDCDIDAMYQDATGFPILNEAGEGSHVAILMVTRRIYKGKISIENAAEYLERNWNRPYNLNETARAANLSPYHFSPHL
jgi:hypothetical protein